MNSANEEAVFAFLDGKISLGDIYKITAEITQKHTIIKNPSIDEIFEIIGLRFCYNFVVFKCNLVIQFYHNI